MTWNHYDNALLSLMLWAAPFMVSHWCGWL